MALLIVCRVKVTKANFASNGIEPVDIARACWEIIYLHPGNTIHLNHKVVIGGIRTRALEERIVLQLEYLKRRTITLSQGLGNWNCQRIMCRYRIAQDRADANLNR